MACNGDIANQELIPNINYYVENEDRQSWMFTDVMNDK